MANQFDSKIRFEPIAWRARCPDTGAVLTIIDNGGHDVTWSLKRLPPAVDTPPFIHEGGTAKNPAAARAKARRALARCFRTKEK